MDIVYDKSVVSRLVGNFKRIWSEGQATRIHKVTVQREQEVEGNLVKEFVVEQVLKQGCPLPWHR